MKITKEKTYVRISREEYKKLKDLQKRFGQFLNYVEHIKEIEQARKDIRDGRIYSQEKLFKDLGI